MQRHTTEQLHVKVAHLHDPFRALTHNGESLRKNRVQTLTRRNPSFKFLRFLFERFVCEDFVFRLKRVDTRHSGAVLLKQAIIATAKEFCQKFEGHGFKTGPHPTKGCRTAQSFFNSLKTRRAVGKSDSCRVSFIGATKTVDFTVAQWRLPALAQRQLKTFVGRAQRPLPRPRNGGASRWSVQNFRLRLFFGLF